MLTARQLYSVLFCSPKAAGGRQYKVPHSQKPTCGAARHTRALWIAHKYLGARQDDCVQYRREPAVSALYLRRSKGQIAIVHEVDGPTSSRASHPSRTWHDRQTSTRHPAAATCNISSAPSQRGILHVGADKRKEQIRDWQLTSTRDPFHPW